jgi:hypothetical protein
MKKYIQGILAIAVIGCLMLPGCGAKGEIKKYTTEYYTVVFDDDACFLQFNEAGIDKQAMNNCEILKYPEYSTLEEMRQGIIAGEISEYEWYCILKTAKRNEDGTIKICNVDELHECVFPINLDVGLIEWSGATYTYLFADGTLSGGMTVVDEERYVNNLDEGYKDFLEYDGIFTEEYDTERAATIYNHVNGSGGKSRYVCYEISTANKSILVQEVYYQRSSSDAKESAGSKVTLEQEMELSYIKLWIEEGDGYAFGTLLGLTERPSLEWLSQFGLREYVETEVA